MFKEFKKLKREMRNETKNIIFNAIFAVSNLMVVSFLYRNIPFASAILILLTISLLLYYRSPMLLPIFVFCMSGAFAEMFAITNGVWTYAAYDFFNIPVWLFILWGNSGLFIYRMAIEFERLGFHE